MAVRVVQLASGPYVKNVLVSFTAFVERTCGLPSMHENAVQPDVITVETLDTAIPGCSAPGGGQFQLVGGVSSPVVYELPPSCVVPCTVSAAGKLICGWVRRTTRPVRWRA